jgi:hypothetical protein
MLVSIVRISGQQFDNNHDINPPDTKRQIALQRTEVDDEHLHRLPQFNDTKITLTREHQNNQSRNITDYHRCTTEKIIGTAKPYSQNIYTEYSDRNVVLIF